MNADELKKIQFILNEKKDDSQNQKIISSELLKSFWTDSEKLNLSKEELIEKMFSLWMDEKKIKDSYRQLLAKNQIIEYVKGFEKDYSLIIWYFKNNGKPFLIEKVKMIDLNQHRMSKANLRDFHNEYEYMVLKKDISEIDAIKLKKQLLYFYYISGYHLINRMEGL